MTEPAPKTRRRRKAADDKPQSDVVQDGSVIIEITEMMVWEKQSRGDYNRNQAYAHVAAAPTEPWRVKVDIGDLQGADAVRTAVAELQKAVHEAVKAQADCMEAEEKADLKRKTAAAIGGHNGNGVQVATAIQSSNGYVPDLPSIESAAGEPPPDDEEVAPADDEF